jgi:predicted O-methyltransferase YrrM
MILKHYPLPPDAPKLMPFQDQPLNGDLTACEEIIRLRDLFRITDVIETGTCFGSTTGFFADNFKCVTTTEINPKFHQIAKHRLRGRENVVCLYGDSLVFMDALAKNARQRNEKLAIQTLIFHDAHWNEVACPLKAELSAIAMAGLKPVIVIHDVQSPHNPELGYDT